MRWLWTAFTQEGYIAMTETVIGTLMTIIKERDRLVKDSGNTLPDRS